MIRHTCVNYSQGVLSEKPHCTNSRLAVGYLKPVSGAEHQQRKATTTKATRTTSADHNRRPTYRTHSTYSAADSAAEQSLKYAAHFTTLQLQQQLNREAKEPASREAKGRPEISNIRN